MEYGASEQPKSEELNTTHPISTATEAKVKASMLIVPQ
jgi:hypothetical protein